jgi:hypothetical protein
MKHEIKKKLIDQGETILFPWVDVTGDRYIAKNSKNRNNRRNGRRNSNDNIHTKKHTKNNQNIRSILQRRNRRNTSVRKQLRRISVMITRKKLTLLRSIISDTNATLTTDEDGNPFLIITSWQELAMIQRELNRHLNPKEYYKWAITYYNEYGADAFKNMRLGWTKEKWDKTRKRCSIYKGLSPYTIPDGLVELNQIVDWGFEDEYMTCGNCGKAIRTTPGYYGDKPGYVILNDEMICGNCIHDNYQEEYIEQCTNNEKNAINTRIVSEEELTELGWKKLSKKYESGLHEGQNDKPINVLNKLKKKFDVLFTCETSQFDITFWAWIKKVE